MNPSNQMKSNEAIVEDLDYLPGCLSCQVSWDYDCHCQQLKRKAKEILLKALQAKDEEAEEKIKDAFFAGFEISGEGFNGEYPYLDRNIELKTDEGLLRRFDEYKEKLTQLQNETNQ